MGLEGKEANKPLVVERGVLGLAIIRLGKANSGTLSNRGRCIKDALSLGELSRNASSGSLVSSKILGGMVGDDRCWCGSIRTISFSSSNKRSNRDVNAGRASSNARQPDMIESKVWKYNRLRLQVW